MLDPLSSPNLSISLESSSNRAASAHGSHDFMIIHHGSIPLGFMLQNQEGRGRVYGTFADYNGIFRDTREPLWRGKHCIAL